MPNLNFSFFRSSPALTETSQQPGASPSKTPALPANQPTRSSSANPLLRMFGGGQRMGARLFSQFSKGSLPPSPSPSQFRPYRYADVAPMTSNDPHSLAVEFRATAGGAAEKLSLRRQKVQDAADNWTMGLNTLSGTIGQFIAPKSLKKRNDQSYDDDAMRAMTTVLRQVKDIDKTAPPDLKARAQQLADTPIITCGGKIFTFLMMGTQNDLKALDAQDLHPAEKREAVDKLMMLIDQTIDLGRQYSASPVPAATHPDASAAASPQSSALSLDSMHAHAGAQPPAEAHSAARPASPQMATAAAADSPPASKLSRRNHMRRTPDQLASAGTSAGNRASLKLRQQFADKNASPAASTTAPAQTAPPPSSQTRINLMCDHASQQLSAATSPAALDHLFNSFHHSVSAAERQTNASVNGGFGQIMGALYNIRSMPDKMREEGLPVSPELDALSKKAQMLLDTDLRRDDTAPSLPFSRFATRSSYRDDGPLAQPLNFQQAVGVRAHLGDIAMLAHDFAGHVSKG